MLKQLKNYMEILDLILYVRKKLKEVYYSMATFMALSKHFKPLVQLFQTMQTVVCHTYDENVKESTSIVRIWIE